MVKSTLCVVLLALSSVVAIQTPLARRMDHRLRMKSEVKSEARASDKACLFLQGDDERQTNNFDEILHSMEKTRNLAALGVQGIVSGKNIDIETKLTSGAADDCKVLMLYSHGALSVYEIPRPSTATDAAAAALVAYMVKKKVADEAVDVYVGMCSSNRLNRVSEAIQTEVAQGNMGDLLSTQCAAGGKVNILYMNPGSNHKSTDLSKVEGKFLPEVMDNWLAQFYQGELEGKGIDVVNEEINEKAMAVKDTAHPAKAYFGGEMGRVVLCKQFKVKTTLKHLFKGIHPDHQKKAHKVLLDAAGATGCGGLTPTEVNEIKTKDAGGSPNAQVDRGLSAVIKGHIDDCIDILAA